MPIIEKYPLSFGEVPCPPTVLRESILPKTGTRGPVGDQSPSPDGLALADPASPTADRDRGM